METALVVILSTSLVLLFADVAGCKAIDKLERRNVARVWRDCVQQAMVEVPSWVSPAAKFRVADQIFRQRKRERHSGAPLPTHLLHIGGGVPAAELIRRYG